MRLVGPRAGKQGGLDLGLDEFAPICPSDDPRYPTIFSPCRKWRYTLWRLWDPAKPYMMVVGLNPSTADEVQNDPTVWRCISFARDWGFGALCMANAFAYRATQPADMKAFPEPVGAENDRLLLEMAGGAGMVLAAWGTHGNHRNRDCELMAGPLAPAAAAGKLMALGVTKDGHPKHPLYIKASTKPVPFVL